MLIRPVEANDFESIAALTNHYILETAIHFGDRSVTAAELRNDWQQLGERYPYLVAIVKEVTGEALGAASGAAAGAEKGALIGYAKAGPWRTRAAYRNTAEVGIYMQPLAQGRGLGRRLYAALVDACAAQGFHALIGGITMPNEASVRLHQSLGFRPIGVFPEVGRKFDRWHDVGFWQLTVVDSAARSVSARQ